MNPKFSKNGPKQLKISYLPKIKQKYTKKHWNQDQIYDQYLSLKLCQDKKKMGWYGGFFTYFRVLLAFFLAINAKN